MIYTFYSFKGGVGRSMALASVAYLLAERGMRVLAIDFDLEAPGLERYFFDEGEARRVRQDPGLIDLLAAYKRALTNEDDFRRAEFRSWWDHVQGAAPSVAGGGRVDLMTAGRREPQERFAEYALAVRSFDWQAFFHDWGGERFFDWLRSEWTGNAGARGYDVVLVDSRTGITEMGGVCAYQLADAAVMLCAANDQNLEGTLRVARDFRSEATQALRRGRELQLLVFPARLDASSPRRADFMRSFKRLFPVDEFLPKQLYENGLDYEALAVPYDVEFAVIERLVGEAGNTPSGQAALQTFARLADALVLMATGQGRLARLQGSTVERLQAGAQVPAPPQVADPTRPGAGFDFYLDDEDLPGAAVREQLRAGLAREQLRVSGDTGALLPGTSWQEALDTQLAASMALVLIVGRTLSAASHARVHAARARGLPVLPLLRLPTARSAVDADRRRLWASLRGADGGDAALAQDTVYDDEPGAWAQRIAHAWRLLRPADVVLDTVAAADPYPGARAYTESEAPLFFGREDELQEWLPRMATARLILLDGPAGVGKTSFVQAGLLPALRRGAAGWAQPLQQMRVLDAQSLERDDAPLPLDVDAQAPLLWVLDHVDSFPDATDSDRVRRRIDAVAALLDRLPAHGRLMLVLRGSFERPEWLRARARWRLDDMPTPALRLHLQPLSPDAMARAIERPAGRLGHVVEPGLSAWLQGQSGRGAGALARVARALPQLWQQRRRGWVTSAALQSAGGLRALLAQDWARWLSSCRDADRLAVQALVQTLTTLDGAMKLAASPAPWERARSILAVPPGVDLRALRDALAAARLLELWRDPASGDVMVALPLDDPTLCGLEPAAQISAGFGAFLLWRNEFMSYVAAWERAGRIDSATLAAQALLDAESRAYRHWDLLSEPERALIGRSHELRREREMRQQQLEHERLESEALRQSRDEALQARREALRQRRAAFVAAALALVGAAAVVWLARSADRQAQAAVAARDTAAAFLADAYADQDPTAAALTLRDVVAGARATESARALRLRVVGHLLTRALLTGHSGAVNHVAFSPDRQLVATASADGTARLWAVADGRLVATLSGHSDWVYHASFSADGQRLLTASRDGSARLWSRDGQPLAQLRAQGGWVYAAAIAPDGHLVATASDDGQLRLWSDKGQLLATVRGHTDAIRHVVFAPDGKTLATASDDRSARLWTRDGKLIAALIGHGDWLTHVAFSPDGQWLATASEDRTVRVWSRDGRAHATLSGHAGPVSAVGFSPDSRYLISASDDRSARLWNRDGEQLLALLGHEGPLSSALFSADGRWLLTASDDRSARVWTRSGSLVAVLRGHSRSVRHAVFAGDSIGIATASDDGSARLWRLDGGVSIALAGHDRTVRYAAFAPQGQYVATVGDDRDVRLWSADGRELAVLSGHGGSVRHASWTADGRRLVTGSVDRTARVWSADGVRLATLAAHSGSVVHVAVSPDGRLVATASADGSARLWSIDGQMLALLSGHRRAVTRVAFAPDGQRLATASDDRDLRLWSIDGRELGTLSGHAGRITGLAWSPDGQHLLSAATDRTARLWTADGKPVAVLEGHSDSVLHAAYRADGKRIVTTSADGSAHLWSASGKPLMELTGHTGAVLHADFAPDGRSLVTAGSDSTVRWWADDGQALATVSRLPVDGTTPAPASGSAVRAVFSPDGNWLLMHLGGAQAEVLPLGEGAFLKRLDHVGKRCHTLAERRRAYPDEDPRSSAAAVKRCEDGR